jgi:WD40 repeat protein
LSNLQSAQDAKTLVCIQQDRIYEGTYTNGGSGYSIQWDVRLVNLSDGTVFDAEAFTGSKPPASRSGSGDLYGRIPLDPCFEWLRTRLGKLVALYGVESVAFSPDGALLATGGQDDIIRLWDLETGNEVKTLDGGTSNVAVKRLAFSPDGAWLASKTGGEIRLWDMVTGERQPVRTFTRANSVSNLAFSPDGKTLASGREDDTVTVWDVRTRQRRAVFSGHESVVRNVAFLPDGKTLVSSAERVKAWDLETGEEVATWEGPVWSLALSPDGQTLAIGGDHDVAIVDMTTKREVRVLRGYADGWSNLVFSSDGSTLAAGKGNLVLMWDVATGQDVRVLAGHTNRVQACAFSPDGKRLASISADNERNWMILWDLSTLR